MVWRGTTRFITVALLLFIPLLATSAAAAISVVSFVDNSTLVSNRTIGLAESFDVVTLNLTVNITNTSAAVVNLTHSGLCTNLPTDPWPMDDVGQGGIFSSTCVLYPPFMEDGKYNLTATAYLVGGAGSNARNFSVYKDTVAPRLRFSWWNTVDEWGYNTTLINVTDVMPKPDIYFGPGERLLSFIVNATDTDGPQTAMSRVARVQVNLSGFHNFTRRGMCDGVQNLTLESSTGKWKYNCTLDAFNATDLDGGDPDFPPMQMFSVTFTATDASGNTGLLYNLSDAAATLCDVNDPAVCAPPPLTIILHDFGLPLPPPPGIAPEAVCIHMGNLTTNLSNVTDFHSVNLITDIWLNLSCMDGLGLINYSTAPSSFVPVGLFNFTGLDFSSPYSAAWLYVLNGAISAGINVYTLPPMSFGEVTIYIDTLAFPQLEHPATVVLYNLPFTQQPNITSDPGMNHSFVIVNWTSGYNALFNATTGNLTFTVGGFSGYDIIDSVSPAINILQPSVGLITSDNITFVNVTIDGTGTPISAVNFTVNGVQVADLDSANCTNTTPDEVIINCVFNITNGDQGVQNLTVVAHDYGGPAPGNVNTASLLYSYDTEPPVISSPSPSGTLSSATTSVTLSVMSDENATCRYSTSDVAYVNMTGNFTDNATAHTALYSVSAGISYTFYVRCADVLGYNDTTSTPIIFNVASASSGGGGGGGGGAPIAFAMTATAVQRTLAPRGLFEFHLPDSTASHTMTVKNITADGVWFELRSTPVSVFLKAGESKSVDINADGIPDVIVTLKSFTLTAATFLVNTPSRAMPPTASPDTTSETTDLPNAPPAAQDPAVSPPAAQPPAQQSVENFPVAAEDGRVAWLWWVVIAIVVVVLVLSYVWMKRSPPKNGVATAVPLAPEQPTAAPVKSSEDKPITKS